jgi:hypothetical protein
MPDGKRFMFIETDDCEFLFMILPFLTMQNASRIVEFMRFVTDWTLRVLAKPVGRGRSNSESEAEIVSVEQISESICSDAFEKSEVSAFPLNIRMQIPIIRYEILLIIFKTLQI